MSSERGLLASARTGKYVLDLPHVSADVVLHFVVSAVSLTVVVVQVRRDRAPAPRVAA